MEAQGEFVASLVRAAKIAAQMTDATGNPLVSPEITREYPDNHMRRMFTAMKDLYKTSNFTSIHRPIMDEFDKLCMQRSLSDVREQANVPAEGSVDFYLAVCKRYTLHKTSGKIKKDNGEEFDMMARLKASIEPLITEAVTILFSEFMLFMSTVNFSGKQAMRSFLHSFEHEMELAPIIFSIRWPKNVFTAFRVDFLKRADFNFKFPRIYDHSVLQHKKDNKFVNDFPYECLVAITVLDDEAAMEKWLRLATKWIDMEGGDSSLYRAIEQCLFNNAHKCLRLINDEVFVKYYGEDFNSNDYSTFSGMFNDWCCSNLVYRTNERPFGYIGRPNWNRMTFNTFKAIYKHPLADVSKMAQPPESCALRSRWVTMVRWQKVRALVLARRFIVDVMEKVAERECRAEFAEDGSALMLGHVAREGRAANAALLGGKNVSTNLDERSCVVHGAGDEFNSLIQNSLNLIQASRLRRLARTSESEEEEESQPEKRARIMR